MISMNIDAQTFYKHFVSLHNKSARQKKKVHSLFKNREKSDLPRGNQNKFNQAINIGLYLLIRNSPNQMQNYLYL